MQTAPDIIASYNSGREPERLALKFAAMRGNAFSFLRGTSHLFWQRVVEAGVDASAPAAWCSGDLHLENFGTYVGDNGFAYFDVNDFDEAALAPCDWDILRLLTSIAVAAPSLGLLKPAATGLMHATADAYFGALASGKARWIERGVASGAIGDLIAERKSQSQKRLLDRRTVPAKGGRRLDVPSDKMLPVSEVDRKLLAAFARTLSTALSQTPSVPGYFKFIDAARRIAGNGSLGIPRFVMLVEGEGSPDANVLLDLKGAIASALFPYSPLSQPTWDNEAERVVAVQHRCQAVSPHFLHAVTIAGQPFVVKELQPSADRLDLASIAKRADGLPDVFANMGRLAAWGQLRSAGRDGSASADGLIAFGRGGDARVSALVENARDLASVTVADFKAFRDEA